MTDVSGRSPSGRAGRQSWSQSALSPPSRATIPSAYALRETEGGLRNWLRFMLGKRGAPTRFAAEHGLTDEQVLGFLRGARPPEPKLLAALGYRREYRYTPCPCFTCTQARTDFDPGPMYLGQSLEMMQMFVCETCGNKRCPHATDHSLACTDSNATGQPGSLYEAFPAQVDGRRMAETGTGSGRSPTSAVGEQREADAPESTRHDH